MFLLQVHIFIASAYFHCFRIFLLQPHGNISHALQKISHVVQKISHGLAVWQNPENRATVIVKTRLRLMATCESHKVLERTRKALNFLQLQQFSTGKEPRNLLFEGSRNGGFEYRSCFSYLNKPNRRI